MTLRRRLVAVTAAVTGLALLAAACSNTTGLPAAVFTNVVDTVSLYALRGTAIALPSAYSIQDRATVRTDTTVNLDFAFDFDSCGKPALLPTAALPRHCPSSKRGDRPQAASRLASAGACRARPARRPEPHAPARRAGSARHAPPGAHRPARSAQRRAQRGREGRCAPDEGEG